MDGVIVDFESGLAQQSEQTLKEYEGRHDEIPGLFGVMKPMLQRKRFRITGNPSRFEMSAHRGKISFSASTKSSPDQTVLF